MTLLGDVCCPAANHHSDKGGATKVKLADQLEVDQLEKGILDTGWFLELLLQEIGYFYFRKMATRQKSNLTFDILGGEHAVDGP